MTGNRTRTTSERSIGERLFDLSIISFFVEKFQTSPSNNELTD